MVLMLFFGAGTFGNVVGIIIQMDIGDRLLLIVTATVLVGGAVGMMLIIGLPQDANALWTGVALYGFASAVTVGFCFNIANRLAYPSAKSTSIIMMGSSIGVSLIPYLASLIYKITHSPLTMMYIGLASMVIPVMLLFIAPRVSYLSHTHKF
jgi:MFS family permease